MTIHDTEDWSSPGGQGPAQVIGDPLLSFGTLLLGSDGGTARAIKVDSSGKLVTSGGGAAGSHVTHAAPFTHADFASSTLHTLVFNDGYTPAVDDWLIDGWVSITTAFNGTTPWGDFGQFASGDVAGFLYGSLGITPIDMTEADSTGNYGFEEMLLGYQNASRLSTVSAVAAVIGLVVAHGIGSPYSLEVGPGYSLERGHRFFPAQFTTTSPMKMCVSRTGLSTGTGSGATAGAGVVYITTATPT